MLALGTCAAGDPDAAGARGRRPRRRRVEELLRYLTVVQVAFPRFARDDLELHGHRSRRASWCSAPWPPPTATRLAGLDTSAGRAGGSHLSFGYGIHRCVGAPLAQMEMRIAYRGLLRRFPGLLVAGEVPWRKLAIVYGVDKLPVAW